MIRIKKGPHHFMMRPVFLLVLSFGVMATAHAKTLIFQTQSAPSPEQLISSSASEPSTQAPRVYKTQSKATSANSELFFMLERLEQEVRYLRGMLEEQGNQIHHLERNGKNRYRDLDSRVLDLSKKVSSNSTVESSSVSAIGSSLSTSIVPVGAKAGMSDDKVLSGVSKASAANLPVPSEAQKREYQQAYGLIKDKSFEEAIKHLHLFIEHYPEGDLAGNAYYWLGEVYLVLPQLEQAKQAFSVVVSAFPTHRKAPDALFKLGVSYDRLQNPAKSEQYLNEVQLKFPESTAAKLAKSYKINR
ncbi:MAG: tol-pal system protein YbgF [Pseudohongiellaceae bacterium]|jgi:tol-pal system protein YbgF